MPCAGRSTHFTLRFMPSLQCSFQLWCSFHCGQWLIQRLVTGRAKNECFLKNVYGYFACMYICAPCVFLGLAEIRREHQMLWNWSCRWVWAAMWVLGIEPRSTGRAASALKHWATSPALMMMVLCLSQRVCWCLHICLREWPWTHNSLTAQIQATTPHPLAF